jgi:PAS domain S-box-containing protein
MLATALSATLVRFWILQGPMSTMDWAAMGVFIVSNLMIAVVAGSTQSSRLRLKESLTEAEGSEVLLRESNAYLESLINYANAPIIVWDPQFRITRFNRAFEALTGQVETEVLGKSLEILFPSELAEHSMGLIRKTLTGERMETVEIKILHLDRTVRTVLWNSATLFAQDNKTPVATIAQGQDVTERKQAEEALRSSESMYRELLDHQGEGFAMLDSLERFLLVNPAAEEIFGVSPGGLQGWSLLEFLAPDQQDLVRRESMLRAKGTQSTYELQIRREDGGRRTLLVTVTPRPGMDGEALQVIGVFRDITERKRAEEGLRKSKASLQAILASAADGILAIDDQRKILHINGRFSEMWHIPQDLVDSGTDKALIGFVLGVLVEPLEFLAKVEALYASDIEDKDICLLKDGRIFERHSSPMMLDGSVTGRVWSFRDITERKQREDALRESNQRLQLATDSAQMAVWDWDLQAGTMTWDDRMFEIYGTNRLETKGTVQDWKDGLHPEDQERAVTECEAALRGEAPFDTEFRVRHRDGTALWIKANATVLRDPEGHPVRMVGINRDITDLHRAEEEQAKLQAQLQQSQKMQSLGTLAGGVAHDMNNVLGAILGLASAHIGTQPYGSPLHKALNTICKATERGGKMVKSLLSFARQQPAESNKLDMNALLKEQVELLERTTLARVRLQMVLEPELRPIQGDASALTNAFMNLCVNAVDAMPENGTLTLHTRNIDNDWIEVVVEDNGMGMPKEVLEKALDPFFTTKGTGKGTGLGLSLVFNTMKAHRGQMAIQSEPGQGTRVMLRLPACENELQVSAPAVAEATLTPHGTLKVLLVDDDELMQSSVQAVLEVLGHIAVTTAASGEEALEILEAGFEPDLVILDMNMPGLGGAGTLPRLRELRPALPVLLSTGRTDQTALTLASAHSDVTLLSKPFGLRELQKQLDSIGLG